MNIIKVKWVDISFYSGVEKDYRIDETEKPVFISIGLDYGVDTMFGKPMQKVCYSRTENGDDNSIVYIPKGCIISEEIIGEDKEI